jgi:hypothetical protein
MRRLGRIDDDSGRRAVSRTRAGMESVRTQNVLWNQKWRTSALKVRSDVHGDDDAFAPKPALRRLGLGSLGSNLTSDRRPLEMVAPRAAAAAYAR